MVWCMTSEVVISQHGMTLWPLSLQSVNMVWRMTFELVFSQYCMTYDFLAFDQSVCYGMLYDFRACEKSIWYNGWLPSLWSVSIVWCMIFKLVMNQYGMTYTFRACEQSIWYDVSVGVGQQSFPGQTRKNWYFRKMSRS